MRNNTEELRSLEKEGKRYSENKDYLKAYGAYYRASVKAKDSGLARMSADYLILAGKAAYEEGGWLNYQKAADCYAHAGETGLLENMLKELNYLEGDITPGSWMGMARYMANANSRRYQQ